MNADEYQKQQEEQEWQEQLKQDPEFAQWLNELEEASGRITKQTERAVSR